MLKSPITSGVIEAEVAPEISQCKVADPPAVILLGLAVKLFITGGLAEVTVTLTVRVVEPWLLVAVRV